MLQSENSSQAFPCSQCGLCCQHVDLATETRFLDRGDGICRHYDELSKLCSIYDERPDICRVDLQYERTYSQQYSWDNFIKVNLVACELLQSQDDIKDL
ncbi:YkgJ family cysteine cluster protein [Vreelandella titanicae]|uniref:YkgJ family cysteine cluster protein n=1 Tax=Vreelandella titanicae TaxID=664683 RepID=UPI0039BF81D2